MEEATGEQEVSLYYQGYYEEGDSILVEPSKENIFVWLMFDMRLENLSYI